MGPKKAKAKGKKKKLEIDPNELTEVDRTFYELTITDLNRKLSRLRTLTSELEDKNEDLKTQLQTLDEDRADVITYLKRQMEEESSQISELQERITALQETRVNEQEEHVEQVTRMEGEYKRMHEQLTSENKLLDGKINSLEEFRAQREDLMKKFTNQENALEEQEKRHKKQLYDIEKKFIISKNRMKRDMETNLFQLSTNFHNTTELRISATTHRVIRENITVNNELQIMLQTQKEILHENDILKQRDQTLRQQNDLYETERNKAINMAKLQKRLLSDLQKNYVYLDHRIQKYQAEELEIIDLRKNYAQAQQDIYNLTYKTKILEQNLHASRSERTNLQTQLLYYQGENERLLDILLEATTCIKEALLVKTDSDPALKLYRRESLLNSLYTLLNTAETNKTRKPSLSSLESFDATYAQGDLGFVPKKVELRSTVPTKRHIESQTGTSLDLAFMETEDYQSPVSSESFQYGGEFKSDMEIFGEEESILFFDENEIISLGEEEEEEEEEDEENIDKNKPSVLSAKLRRSQTSKKMQSLKKRASSSATTDGDKTGIQKGSTVYRASLKQMPKESLAHLQNVGSIVSAKSSNISIRRKEGDEDKTSKHSSRLDVESTKKRQFSSVQFSETQVEITPSTGKMDSVSEAPTPPPEDSSPPPDDNASQK